MKTKLHFSIAVAFALGFLSFFGSTKTPSWRGDGSGRFPDSEIVDSWSQEKNIVWKCEMPGWSNASPIIVGERVFTYSEPDQVICVDARNGSVLWKDSCPMQDFFPAEEKDKALEAMTEGKKLFDQIDSINAEKGKINAEIKKKGEGDTSELKKNLAELNEKTRELQKKLNTFDRKYMLPRINSVTGYTTPTPVSDGEYLYSQLGTGVTLCHTLDGKRKWGRLVAAPSGEPSASPVLIKDKLIVFLGKIHALDKKTGENLWSTECKQLPGSLIQSSIDGLDVIITPQGDIIRADNGVKIVTQSIGLTYNTPVVHDDEIFFIQESSKAFKMLKTDEGLRLEPLWEQKIKNDRYYASPLWNDGLIHAITQKNIYTVLDAANGEKVFEETLDLGGGTVYPSIVLAGDKILVSSDNGTTLLLKPGRELKELARNKLGEGFRSTPTPHGDQLYIRGLKNLYRIGK